MSEATGIREKAAATAAKAVSDFKTNIAAMAKAIKALEDGMSGSFLQTSDAAVLRHLIVSADMEDADRDMVTSFLSQGQGENEDAYAPSSGEVIGLLKQMKETMEKDLATTESNEAESLASYEELIAAKKKEVAALTKQIETKSSRLAEVGVEIVNLQEDLEDTEASLEKDQAFLAELEATCKTRAAKYAEQKKVFGEESIALADTIKLLNDDDALELFKKTLPSPSLLQLQVSTKELLRQAHAVLKSQRRRHDHRLDLISLALHGKKADFGKVLKMIDDMVALLKEEQTADETKVADCKASLEEASDKAASLELTASGLQKAIDEMEEKKASLVDEIAALDAGIKSLDESVAEATAQRKTEHTAFVEEMNDNKAAVEILNIAKNRMNKFYNPGLYKPPPETFIQESAATLLQVSEHRMLQRKQDSSGVIHMMDTILNEMAKEMQEAELNEKAAQEDYETFMADSKSKRAADSKTLEAQESAKADLDARLVKHAADLKSTKVSAMNNAKFISELHGDCDWLMENLDVRKDARTSEIDSLKKAKAVLSGADYSLVQVHRSVHRYLRASHRK
mmetsp:Transcript_62137/g.117786  ORF Transcript_62137/g.117786 Transcript_62137/m.117786 type:complete len:570 (-) Transcript_62137:34-1743(-)